MNPLDTSTYYLNRWGGNLTYVQIMNEPETSSSWNAGALFTDDEIISDFNSIYATVESHHLSVQFYTNFGIGYSSEATFPVNSARNLTSSGLDVYMNSFLVLSPFFIEKLAGDNP